MAAAVGVTTTYEVVVAELKSLHEQRDWTPEHQERYRELCALERALRRRRKAHASTH